MNTKKMFGAAILLSIANCCSPTTVSVAAPPERSAVDQLNDAGFAPLHYAAMHGKAERVTELIQAGA
ncbi:MAG: ankyrin repeat domain-containing protein, partial [Pirellulaceae bacterium]|nr:ankyrin repeat domain-containing protein [Pirellulaceae bacterium]